MMEKKRPKGIAMLGYILIGMPLLKIIMGLIMTYPYISTLKTTWISPTGLIMVAQIITGIGILKLKYWASRAVMYIAALYIIGGIGFLIFAIISTAEITFGRFSFSISGASFGCLLNIFFNRPKIKEQFKQEK